MGGRLYLTSDCKFFYPSTPGTSDPLDLEPPPPVCKVEVPALPFSLEFMMLCVSGGVVSEDPEGLKAQSSL